MKGLIAVGALAFLTIAVEAGPASSASSSGSASLSAAQPVQVAQAQAGAFDSWTWSLATSAEKPITTTNAGMYLIVR